jgi:hypothetical protein
MRAARVGPEVIRNTLRLALEESTRRTPNNSIQVWSFVDEPRNLSAVY